MTQQQQQQHHSSSTERATPLPVHGRVRYMKSFPSRSKQLGLVIRTQCDHSTYMGIHVSQQDWKRKQIEKQWPFMLVQITNRWQDLLRESVLKTDSSHGLRSSWHTQRHVRALSWKRRERCDGSTLSTDIWMSIHMAEDKITQPAVWFLRGGLRTNKKTKKNTCLSCSRKPFVLLFSFMHALNGS